MERKNERKADKNKGRQKDVQIERKNERKADKK